MLLCVVSVDSIRRVLSQPFCFTPCEVLPHKQPVSLLLLFLLRQLALTQRGEHNEAVPCREDSFHGF